MPLKFSRYWLENKHKLGHFSVLDCLGDFIFYSLFIKENPDWLVGSYLGCL